MWKAKEKQQTKTSKQLANNRRRLLRESTPFAVKEAYVKLRTNLLFCMTADGKRPCQVFAVTSANAAEGKSLTAANIAISFGMLGKRTLLIDADLRKPTQQRLWQIDEEAGLCDFLAGFSELVTRQVDTIPLTILCAGTIPPNPSELLASDRMRRFVEEAMAEYDYVFIDLPPINVVADAQIVAPFVDGVLLVARSGHTTAEGLLAAADSVRRAGGNLCGIVLNDLNMKSAKYSYHYKYGDDYGYQYTYENTDK